MRRLVWTLLVLVPAFSFEGRIAPSSATVQATDQLSLQQTLLIGLEARRPKDREFVRYVVSLVEDGKLPRKYVMMAFSYVRKRHRFENYKVIVFRKTLRRIVVKHRINVTI